MATSKQKASVANKGVASMATFPQTRIAANGVSADGGAMGAGTVMAISASSDAAASKGVPKNVKSGPLAAKLAVKAKPVAPGANW